MNTNNQDPTYMEIMRKMIWIVRMHRQYNDTRLEGLDMGSAQVHVIMSLIRHGEMTQRDLAEHGRVTPATMSGTLKRMEKSGLICRSGVESDARISMVKLTPEGIARSEEVFRIFRQSDDVTLEGIDVGQLEKLDRLFSRMESNLKKALHAEGEMPKRWADSHKGAIKGKVSHDEKPL